MTAYLVNIALLFVWAALFLWQPQGRKNKKLFCALASVQWIALSGLRHVSVGADTLQYKAHFDRVLYISWNELLGRAWGTYFGPLELKDPGYAIFVKAMQLVSHDYQVFLILIAMVFTIPLGVFIYRYSTDPLLSFLIYSTLFYSFFAITGIRQTVATALVVLIGYHFIEKRRLVPFLLLAAAAFTIHASSVGFVPFYFLANKRLSGWIATALLGAPIVVYVFRLEVMQFLGALSGYEQYARQFEGAGTWVFTGMLVLTVIVTLVRFASMPREEPHVNAAFNALLLGLVFAPLTFLDPNAMRVVQYATLFLLILGPALVASFQTRHERAIVHLVAASALVFLFVGGNPQYIFFWQGL
ncbi:MAG: EpsG family protein [Coriobacteriia bacterium]|nr:EpsG family protein [Coriobacteriia bacterium]